MSSKTKRAKEENIVFVGALAFAAARIHMTLKGSHMTPYDLHTTRIDSSRATPRVEEKFRSSAVLYKTVSFYLDKCRSALGWKK